MIDAWPGLEAALATFGWPEAVGALAGVVVVLASSLATGWPIGGQFRP